MKIKQLTMLVLATLSACDQKTNEQAPAIVYFGDIQPHGWLKEQMTFDVTQGFVGNLDQLVPELILEDDIYGKDRMTKLVKSKDVGAVTDDNGEWQVQFLWWNSETQSNWWDGFIRNAILTQDAKSLEKVKSYVDAKLETQDADGYMGVYAQDLRYNHTTENGELWAQSSLFRGLLAYYEYTKDQRILTAVEKAVKLTMKRYPINGSQPFNIEKPYAGVGHGLTFVDVLNRLYELTGNIQYLDYALFLYEDYNRYALSEVDIQVKNLLDTAYKFKGHGVHTYEHLRALVLAAERSDNPVYKPALEAYLDRLATVITPSGAPIGDEWILGKSANADHTGYEYCSLQELLDSYSLLLAKTGDSKWADSMEWLLFNAAQGARNPDGKSIAYCKTDNSYFMQGALERENIGKANHSRFKYSPVHKEVAVCCVPNAGRIYPYYVKSMWSSTSKGFKLDLFGPSTFSSSFNGQNVKIEQLTNYPFDLNIRLKLTLEDPLNFQLAIRKPEWATSYKINTNAVISESAGHLLLKKEWKTGDEVSIQFETKPRFNVDQSGEFFVSHGPLVFALPIESEKQVTKTYNLSGFQDILYDSEARVETKWMLRDLEQPLEVQRKSNGSNWHDQFIGISLIDDSGDSHKVNLLPMGGLVLRQVTFPQSD